MLSGDHAAENVRSNFIPFCRKNMSSRKIKSIITYMTLFWGGIMSTTQEGKLSNCRFHSISTEGTWKRFGQVTVIRWTYWLLGIVVHTSTSPTTTPRRGGVVMMDIIGCYTDGFRHDGYKGSVSCLGHWCRKRSRLSSGRGIGRGRSDRRG